MEEEKPSRSSSPLSEKSTGRQTPLDSPTDRTDSDLSDVARRMARGVRLKDRVHLLKEYKCCFKGTDGVKWLMSSGLCRSIEEAVRLGNRLREQGFIRHVTNAYIFSNKDYYYWFHESVLESCDCQSSSSYKSLLGLRGTATADDHDMGNELIQLQRTVHAIKTVVEGKLHRSLNDVERLSERMKKFEDMMEREAERQRRWMGAGVVVLTGVWVMSRMPYVEWLIGGLTVAVVMHAAIYLVRHGWSVGNTMSATNNRQEVTPTAVREAIVSQSIASEERIVQVSDFVEWPDAPCLLLAPPCLMFDHPRMVRMNTDVTIPFETELFKGEAVMYCDGLPSSPPELFKGKKRKSCSVIRGRFKEAVSFDDVLTGQQFSRSLRNIPAEFFLKAILKFAKTLNPSSTYQLCPEPAFLTHLVCTAQVITVSEPGTEPSLKEAVEDMLLVSSVFADASGTPLSSLQRKRLLQQSCTRSNFYFDTEHVWTFHFWQHLLDLSTFQLDLTIKKIHLLHHLNGQPLAILSRTTDGRLLWNLEIYHQGLLQ